MSPVRFLVVPQTKDEGKRRVAQTVWLSFFMSARRFSYFIATFAAASHNKHFTMITQYTKALIISASLWPTVTMQAYADKNADTVKAINLAGQWNVTLGDSDKTKTATLPGTIDTNGLGNAPTDTTETARLTRVSAFKGKASYSRTVNIPKAWKKRPLTLLLERTKPTWVYLDGALVDSCNNISTPHRYALPSLKPGKHLLTVVVDNSRGVPEQIYASSHAYSEDTQTNWNGIIGRMELGVAEAKRNEKTKADKKKGRSEKAEAGEEKECGGWDTSTFKIERSDADGHPYFSLGGHRIFLRGKHDACVWPLTGHTPMDVQSWLDYFYTCDWFGINHVRFHSWCPPEAAFVAADSVHIFLQPELPFWGTFDDKDSTLMAFLHKEGENILREYGHHASFRMMALGNELSGSIDKMREFVDDFRHIAPDKYYTFGSNYYLGYQGIQPGMDYITTCRIGGEKWGEYGTHTRGSFSFADACDGGTLNHFYPGTTHNFDEACDKASVPVISHETGQFQTYPDYSEIDKYTGVLHPYNLKTFRRRLADAGMLRQAEDFHVASGLWSAQLYKADIEMCLRTRHMSGFQLLDLQDYPGQGSAYVGILDAFMDSKRLVTLREWRQWCSPVVPLLVTDRFCYEEGDTLRAAVQVANYGESSLKGKTLVWSIDGESGSMTLPDGEGLLDVGSFSLPVHADTARQSLLSLRIEGTDSHNTYNIWVYPHARINNNGVTVTKEMSADVIGQLEQGASVLWTPDSLVNTVGPLFQTDYWNYRMFKAICQNAGKAASPGTLGILTDPDHPIFSGFPTENHTNWQWFDIVKNSRPLILDSLPSGYLPIVQVIDNVERNHKLGIVMEWKVGKGKLLLCTADLDKVLAAGHPEGRAFYSSLLDYMRSDHFQPRHDITVEQLLRLANANETDGSER